MPKYTYHLKNGKTMVLEGDTQPSDAEVEALAKENKVELALSDDEAKHEKAQGYLKQPFGMALKDTAKNAVTDAVDTAKGVGNLAFSVLPRATGELGASIGGRVRELVGLDPHYPEGTPNIDTLASIPGAFIDHLKQYGNEDDRAIMMREHPFQVASDLAGVASLGKAAAAAGSKLANTPVKMPSASTVAKAAIDYKTGGLTSVARNAAKQGMVSRLLGRTAKEAGPSAADEASAALREATKVQDDLAGGYTKPIATNPSQADIAGFSRGRIQMPPQSESAAASASRDLLSPEAQQLREATSVTEGATNPIRMRAQTPPTSESVTSAATRDLFSPESQYHRSTIATAEPAPTPKPSAEAVAQGKAAAKRGKFNTQEPELDPEKGLGYSSTEQVEPSAVDVEDFIKSLETGGGNADDLLSMAKKWEPPRANAANLSREELATLNQFMGQGPDPTAVASIRDSLNGWTARPMDELTPGQEMALRRPQAPPNPNAGGRLVPRGPNMVQSILEDIRKPESVERSLAVSHPQTGSFTLEPQYGDYTATRTGQPTEISPGIEAPKPKTVETGAKASEPAKAASQPAPKKGVKQPSSSFEEDLFKRLSKKTILTPEEETQLANLQKIMKGRASNQGLRYAAGGRGR